MGGHLLTRAKASHKYCRCQWHHDPVLSPQHAASHSQSNAYLSLYFLCLSLSSLARQGGGGMGAVAGEWGEVCSVPLQLSSSSLSQSSLCLNTDCPAPGRPAMAPVQGQDQLADAPTQMANQLPGACVLRVPHRCAHVCGTGTLPAPALPGIDVSRLLSSHVNNVILGPRPANSSPWKVGLRGTPLW